ncbi:MAG: hypothetical protein GY927_22710 [bacterium]|nr:hypothetical protein [bacterium]
MRCLCLDRCKALAKVFGVLVSLFFLVFAPVQVEARDGNDRPRPLAQVYELIEDFVREDYLSNWFASPRLIRRHFADPLDYYWGKKDVPLTEVVRDKMAYITRWPQRYFRLISESLEVIRTPEDPYIYAVRFRYEFETKRKGDEKAGLGQTSLLLELFNKRVMIRGEGGKVLERY